MGVMMMVKQKFALAVSIVLHVNKRRRTKKGAVGKASKKVCSTVMRSGVHVIVLVAIVVDHARESVRIMTYVASLKLDIANETAKKGLVLTESVKVEMMMVKEKFALAVKVVVHASVSARITKGVAGNLQESVRAIAKRSTVLAKLFLLSFAELMSG